MPKAGIIVEDRADVKVGGNGGQHTSRGAKRKDPYVVVVMIDLEGSRRA